jgi:hypothetical protein
MEIGPGTKVHELLERYPFLEDDLILLSPAFRCSGTRCSQTLSPAL